MNCTTSLQNVLKNIGHESVKNSKRVRKEYLLIFGALEKTYTSKTNFLKKVTKIFKIFYFANSVFHKLIPGKML